MKKNQRRPAGFLWPSWPWLAGVLVAATVAAAASSSIAAAKTTTDNYAPTTKTTVTVVDAAADEDDDDDGGGVLDSVFPFKALQLYNTLAGYMEYIYDMITGECFFFFDSIASAEKLSNKTCELLIFTTDDVRHNFLIY